MYRIGGTRTRRGVLLSLDKTGLVVGAAYLVLMLVAMAATGNVAVIVTMLLGAGLLWLLLRIPVEGGPAWLRSVQFVGRAAGRRRGWTAFERTALTPVPRPVGPVLMMGSAREEGAAELAIVRHAPLPGLSWFTTTIEVEGGGDGVWSTHDQALRAGLVEDLLGRLAEGKGAVDEISFLQRAMPGLPRGYRSALMARIPERLQESVLAANLDDLLAMSEQSSDQYRTFVTITVDRDRLARTVERSGRLTRENLTAGVHEELARVVRLLQVHGFKVIRGLGPRRFGALLRHCYTPSRSMEDLTGIESAADGFVEYPDARRTALVVPDPDSDVTWHHATASVPPSAWPEAIESPRWTSPLVCSLFEEEEPSVIRTITTTYRLVPRDRARRQIISNVKLDRAQALNEEGKVNDGSNDISAGAGQDMLTDLRTGASGVQVSTRVTVSAPSKTGLEDARDTVDNAASRMGVEGGLRWADGRQAEAFVWSLPLGRGIRRLPTPAAVQLAGQLKARMQ